MQIDKDKAQDSYKYYKKLTEEEKGMYELYQSWCLDKKKSYEHYAEKSRELKREAGVLEEQVRDLEKRKSDKTEEVQAEEIKLDIVKLELQKAVKNWVPAYHFFICDLHGNRMGKCDLRIGYNDNLYYGGHIGYTVFPEYRGNHYAAKACLLLFQLAKKHDMKYLYITCNPDNYASRKTCEYAKGKLMETVELPEGNDMRDRGESEKCIYKFILSGE